jgi:hypothetical protein
MEKENGGFPVISRFGSVCEQSALNFLEMSKTGYPDKRRKKSLDIIVKNR